MKVSKILLIKDEKKLGLLLDSLCEKVKSFL